MKKFEGMKWGSLTEEEKNGNVERGNCSRCKRLLKYF